MVGMITHAFSATQAEQTSNSLGQATTWVGPNEWNTAHNISVTLTGATAGVSSLSGTNIVLGASNNLTVSGSGATIYFVGPTLTQYASGITLAGNSVGTSSIQAALLTIAGGQNITVSGGTAGAGVTISGPSLVPYLSGLTITGNSAGTSSITAGALTLSAGANITLSASNGAVTISAAAGGGTQTITLAGNTSNSTTVALTNLTISATNNLTVSGAANAIVLSGPSLTPYASGITVTGNSLGTSSIAASALTLSAGANVTLSASNGALTISANPVQTITITGNTLGQSTAALNTIGATQNLTVSGGANGITIQGPQLSAFVVGGAPATTLGLGAGHFNGIAFVLPTELAISRVNVFVAQALSALTSTVTTFTTTSSGQFSTTGGSTYLLGLWSRGVGTSTGTLYSVASASMAVNYSATFTQSQSTTNFTEACTMSVTYSTGVPFGSSTTTYSGSTTASATSNQATMLTAATADTVKWAAGILVMPFPLATTIEPGEYYLGLMPIYAGNTSCGPSLTNFRAAAGLGTNLINAGYFGAYANAAAPAVDIYFQPTLLSAGTSSTAIPSPVTMSNLASIGTGNQAGPLAANLVGYGTNTALP
jgi:hypothetical protein